MKARIRWMGLLVVVIVLFFWKILFTHQFTPFLDYDDANQAYAWDHFAAASIKQEILPLWDPYSHAGRSFIGDMQTGFFYPLKLLLYLWPFDGSGLFSLELLHDYYVLGHVLGAFFMFLLAEELGLDGFSAFVTALCFSLGGFVGGPSGGWAWPDMLDSAIWLPLIALFLIRALASQSAARGLFYACLTGLGLAMAVLGGMLHPPMMDALLVVSASAYFAYRSWRQEGGVSVGRSPWRWSATVVTVAGVTAFTAAAIQLLPSIEYSGLAVRWIDDWSWIPARQKIPFVQQYHNFVPHSLLGFLFGGMSYGSEEYSPYFGVLPLLLSVAGVWRNWERPWVRYLSALAVLAFFYTLGPFSFLFGLGYSLVPYLWMAREPGRFIYLAHFAMALLAGFGVQTLFSEKAAAQESFGGLARVLKWIVIATAVAVTIPALSWKPEMNEWTSFSLLMQIASYGLFVYLIRGHRTKAAQFVLVALIASDLQAFTRNIQNKIEAQNSGKNYLEELLKCRNLANFFRSQSGLFRVQRHESFDAALGDLFGVETTWGRTATVLKDFQRHWEAPKASDLLNVRYFVMAKTANPALRMQAPWPATADRPPPAPGASDSLPVTVVPRPVFEDGAWKVYENPSYCPRAWIVHQAMTGLSDEEVRHRMQALDFDPLRLALVSEQLEGELQTTLETSREEVTFPLYRADRLELKVHAAGRGLLVLSEVHYPGWQGTVNGQPARIYKVDGLLRGVVVPAGESRVMVRYAPNSFRIGAILTCLTFLGTAVFGEVLRVREKRGPVS